MVSKLQLPEHPKVLLPASSLGEWEGCIFQETHGPLVIFCTWRIILTQLYRDHNKPIEESRMNQSVPIRVMECFGLGSKGKKTATLSETNIGN